MKCWIIENLGDLSMWGRTEYQRASGLYRILSLQTSLRSRIIGNMASALTAQKSFLNNFKKVENHRVDIQEDIRHYQDTLSYKSSKVNYSVGEGVYMLSSDMNPYIRSGTAGYNEEILVSNSWFSLGRNNSQCFSTREVES